MKNILFQCVLLQIQLQLCHFLCYGTASSYNCVIFYVTVQLKGDLIPAHVLQVEHCRVKITSCFQYLNGCPVKFMPASGKLSGVCTYKHYIILYEFLNEYYHNINSIYMMNF